MQLQVNKLSKISISALFTVFAAICGILEGMLPLQLIIPVPGVKLGIANIFIVFAFKCLGAPFALAVSLARSFLVFIFTGNTMAFALSISGALFSFVSLYFMMKLQNKVFSYIGVSSVCAVFHGAGQIALAYIIIGSAVLYYLPVLLSVCALTGVFTGALMNASEKKVLSTFKV